MVRREDRSMSPDKTQQPSTVRAATRPHSLMPSKPPPSTSPHSQTGRRNRSAERRFMLVMAVSVVLAMGSSAFAAAVDTFPQWGPKLLALATRMFSDQSPVSSSIFQASSDLFGLSSSRLDTALIDRILVAPSSSIPAGNFYVAMSALLSASGICCAALLTHGLGGRMKHRHLTWMFFQPFVGGVRFILMQAMAWTLFAFSLLVFSAVAAVAVFIGRALLGQGLLASAGVTGLASEFLLIASLLIFESPSKNQRPQNRLENRDAKRSKMPIHATRESAGSAGKKSRREVVEEPGHDRQPAATAAESLAAARISLGERVTVHGETEAAATGKEGGSSARAGSEKGEVRIVCPAPWTARQLAIASRRPSEMLSLLLASALPSGKAAAIADRTVPNSNGARAKARGGDHGLRREVDGETVRDAGNGGESEDDDAAGSMPLVPAEGSDEECKEGEGMTLSGGPVTAWEVVWWCWVKARAVFSVCVMYATQHALAVSICMPAFCCQLSTAVIVYAGVVAAFVYCNVCGNKREKNGKSHWLWLQPYCVWLLEECSAAYFNAIRIVRDGDASLYPSTQRYIFTYHPHGLLPAIMAWFFHSSAWASLFPGIRPVALVASILFRVPLLRQLCLWGGLREVSREGFSAAVHDKGAAILCPGGQSELSYHSTSSEGAIVLCARKVGFVRMALETRSLLVPVFCFGEASLFDNLFHMPSVQRFTYRRFGFPIPFAPIGLFGLLPLPRTSPVTLVVGRPFDPAALLPAPLDSTEGASGGAAVSMEQLCAIRDRYYSEVHALFEKHKAERGMAGVQLELRK